MSEKNLPPSQKRLQKLKKDGHWPKSKAAGHALQWIAVLGAAPYFARGWIHYLKREDSTFWIESRFSGSVSTFLPWKRAPLEALLELIPMALVPLLQILGVWIIAGLINAAVQNGGMRFNVSTGSGLRQIGVGAWWSRTKEQAANHSGGMLQLIITMLFVWPGVTALFEYTSSIARTSSAMASPAIMRVLDTLRWRLILSVGITGIASYAYVRWRFFRRNRMSLEEAREEYRQDEGDPHIKSMRRHEHEALIMQDLARRVRAAKVIVVRSYPSTRSQRG